MMNMYALLQLTKVTKIHGSASGIRASPLPPSAAQCSRFLMGAESKSDTPLAGWAGAAPRSRWDGQPSMCLTSLSSLALICQPQFLWPVDDISFPFANLSLPFPFVPVKTPDESLNPLSATLGVSAHASCMQHVNKDPKKWTVKLRDHWVSLGWNDNSATFPLIT